MRGEFRERGTIDEVDNENNDSENWPVSKSGKVKTETDLDGKGKIKWHERLPYSDFVDDLPMLRYVRGSKTKISITTFDEIGKVCQQIFECNKSFFRFRVQVDLLSHYIGARILEQIYIARKNRKKHPLAVVLEGKEKQYEIWDQMKSVKEIFSALCEKKADGFISDDEMDSLVEEYIGTFENPDDRIKMAEVIDVMLRNGEEVKASERLRQRKLYGLKQRKKEEELQEVV